MTKDQNTIKIVKEIVKDMYDKINENGGYYVKDLTYEVEELAEFLELDITFDGTEIIDLKKAGYKLSKDNKVATKTYRKIPVMVTKSGFSEYTLQFGKGKYKELEDNTPDLYDITDSTNGFFTDLLKSYKEMLSDY